MALDLTTTVGPHQHSERHERSSPSLGPPVDRDENHATSRAGLLRNES